MSILLDRTNRVVVQGITGAMGRFFVADSGRYGTTIVAGVSPGRGGANVEGVPVFGSVAAACASTAADTAIVFVPPAAVAGAAMEAIEAGCRLVVMPADEVPVADTIALRAVARPRGCALIGPNTPGIISPGKAKLGFMPSFCYAEGNVGVISRSGSLSYEVSQRLTRAGIGQSTVLGIGGDPIKGTSAAEAVALFDADPETHVILSLGEIGGTDEYDIAAYAARPDAKPVAALLVGRVAPPGKRMGHAGALIGSAADTYAAKTNALREAGVHVADGLGDVVDAVRAALHQRGEAPWQTLPT